MYMRWLLPFPGMLARSPIASGDSKVSQMFTVAQSSLRLEAACAPPRNSGPGGDRRWA